MAASAKQNDSKNSNVLVWKNKTEKAKKGEIIRELHKLHVQVVSLEREKTTHMYSKRSDFRQDFLQLEEMDTKTTNSRKTEQIKLKQQLEKISHMVKHFHKELKDIKPTPEFVEKLKVIMEEIEGTINAFKEQQKTQYEELMREERTTWQEIQALDRKFETWSQLTNATVAKKAPSTQVPLASARDITKDLPPEVAAFEKFLEQNGGIRGGWDEYDHQTFLKFRLRHKGKSAFITHCLMGIPTRTEEEILSHEDWYQTYLSLNEEKKNSIQRWKERRQEEKDVILTKAEKTEKEQTEAKLKAEAKLKEQIEEEKRDRFAKLNAWKVQKELERVQAEEKELRAQLEKSKAHDQERQRQLEMRAKVEEYRRQKEVEETYVRQQQEMYEREQQERQKQISAREIGRFRERDEKKLKEKQIKDISKEEERKEKERRLAKLKSQVEVEVVRDPNRLLKPTAGWKSRLKDDGSADSGGQVLHMPHRAVPSWRQGLN